MVIGPGGQHSIHQIISTKSGVADPPCILEFQSASSAYRTTACFHRHYLRGHHGQAIQGSLAGARCLGVNLEENQIQGP